MAIIKLLSSYRHTCTRWSRDPVSPSPFDYSNEQHARAHVSRLSPLPLLSSPAATNSNTHAACFSNKQSCVCVCVCACVCVCLCACCVLCVRCVCIQVEEAFLVCKHGEAYNTYRTSTPKFLPRDWRKFAQIATDLTR